MRRTVDVDGDVLAAVEKIGPGTGLFDQCSRVAREAEASIHKVTKEAPLELGSAKPIESLEVILPRLLDGRNFDARPYQGREQVHDPLPVEKGMVGLVGVA